MGLAGKSRENLKKLPVSLPNPYFCLSISSMSLVMYHQGQAPPRSTLECSRDYGLTLMPPVCTSIPTGLWFLKTTFLYMDIPHSFLW